MNNRPIHVKKSQILGIGAGLIVVCSVISLALFFLKEEPRLTKTAQQTEQTVQRLQTNTSASQAEPKHVPPERPQPAGQPLAAPSLPSTPSTPSTPRHLDFAHQYVPPIGKKTAHSDNYQGDLSDLTAYQEYEHNQQKRLKLAYIQASKAKITELTQWLNRGQAAKLSQEQLNEAKEKIIALQHQADQLSLELNQ